MSHTQNTTGGKATLIRQRVAIAAQRIPVLLTFWFAGLANVFPAFGPLSGVKGSGGVLGAGGLEVHLGGGDFRDTVKD